MKVLVLGGTGFIGTYLVQALLDAGASVTVVDRKPAFAFPLEKGERVKLILRDLLSLQREDFRSYDLVIHLAAILGGVRFFHRYPYTIASENTATLLKSISFTLEANPHALFIYFSSSMVFERSISPVREEDLQDQKIPKTSYGMQKLFGETLVRSAHEEKGLNYLIVRPFNAIGVGEVPYVREGEILWGMSHVLPEFVVKALLEERPFHMIGSGEQVRTFTHARDIARAVLLMIEKGIMNEDFNLCGRETLTIRELGERVWRFVHPDLPFPGFASDPGEPLDVGYRVASPEKAKKLLHWEPSTTLEETLKELVPFLRTWLESTGLKILEGQGKR